MLKTRRPIPVPVIAGTISAAAFAVIGTVVQLDRIGLFDRFLIDAIQGSEAPGLTKMMQFFTFIGNGLPVAVITLILMAFLYLVLGHRRELLLLSGVMIGSTILNKLLKTLFVRERPNFHRIIEETGYSFPSGHSMAAFCLYGTVAFLLWKHISSRAGRFLLVIISIGFMIMIGFSRIYLGVHYPSDVLGAYFAGGFWLSCSVWLYRRYIA